ncbi:MAG: HigA family addiction module antidote protein [Deltaproteobacteria bacterium]|nr:HigA family addiction module antidote protein [Deltaproteobacteria bacterium]
MWTHEEAHPGEYLRVRFLQPLGLSASELARRCRMPRSRVSDILAGKRGISADTAKRLAALFRMEPEAWMALQASWDLHRAAPDDAIVPLDPPGFLLGPMGATALPSRRSRSPILHVPADFDARMAAEAPPPTYGPTGHEEVRYSDGTRALVAKTE